MKVTFSFSDGEVVNDYGVARYKDKPLTWVLLYGKGTGTNMDSLIVWKSQEADKGLLMVKETIETEFGIKMNKVEVNAGYILTIVFDNVEDECAFLLKAS